MKPNRILVSTKVIDILDEIKGSVKERRDFLKLVNDLVNKPFAMVETMSEYMNGGNDEEAN